MPRAKTPEPTPVLSSDGVRIVVRQPLTLGHPHCVVARRDFTAGFIATPDGHGLIPGLTYIHKGQLGDDRSPFPLRRSSRRKCPG